MTPALDHGDYLPSDTELYHLSQVLDMFFGGSEAEAIEALRSMPPKVVEWLKEHQRVNNPKGHGAFAKALKEAEL